MSPLCVVSLLEASGSVDELLLRWEAEEVARQLGRLVSTAPSLSWRETQLLSCPLLSSLATQSS